MTEVVEELKHEIEMIEALQEQRPDDQSLRRVLTRSVFAAIEALTTVMLNKSVAALAKIAASEVQCSEDRHRGFFEICEASNVSYTIDDTGRVKLGEPKTPLKNRTLFAIRSVAKMKSVQIEPKQISGWENFGRAIKVRDRITHPKALSDLAITEEDQRDVIAAFQWLVLCNHRASGGTTY